MHGGPRRAGGTRNADTERRARSGTAVSSRHERWLSTHRRSVSARGWRVAIGCSCERIPAQDRSGNPGPAAPLRRIGRDAKPIPLDEDRAAPGSAARVPKIRRFLRTQSTSRGGESRPDYRKVGVIPGFRQDGARRAARDADEPTPGGTNDLASGRPPCAAPRTAGQRWASLDDGRPSPTPFGRNTCPRPPAAVSSDGCLALGHAKANRVRPSAQAPAVGRSGLGCVRRALAERANRRRTRGDAWSRIEC